MKPRPTVRKEITTRINYATEQAYYYFSRLKKCENGGGNVANSTWATKFAQAIRIENHYKNEFAKWLNS